MVRHIVPIVHENLNPEFFETSGYIPLTRTITSFKSPLLLFIKYFDIEKEFHIKQGEIDFFNFDDFV